MKRFQNKQLLLSVLVTLASPAVYADFGGGLILDNQDHRYNTDKNEIRGSLDFQYRGEKFNVDNAASYELIGSEHYAVEAILKSNNRGFSSDDDKTFQGMKERNDSIDLGLRAIGSVGGAFVKLPLVLELTKDVHSSKGVQADLKIGGIEPHAEHWNGKREIIVSPAAGIRYQDKKTVDYYYGVKASEATSNRLAYKGDAAITPYIGVESQMNISKRVSLNAGLFYERRDDSIRKSTLTDESKGDVLGNIGLTYWFK